MTSSTDRLADINAMLDCDHTDPIRPDCIHDLRARDIRALLIDDTDDDLESPDADTLRDHILALREHAELPHDESATTALSMLALDFSLCPMHMIDYAICFDDDDPDCATIRAFFPSHDT